MSLAFRATLRDPESKVIAGAAVVVVAVGTIVYMLVEGWSPLEAAYFCVVTLATVGYGDLYPTSDVGRLFTIFYIITGIGIIGAFVAELAKHGLATGRLGTIVERVENRSQASTPAETAAAKRDEGDGAP